ncbi:MAG: glycoside hydrolase, partial [Clostridia bacterium]|nr:glycoside hydrolase [Clostridia bacterium]
ALLLTVLAYNVGHSRLLGYGKRPKSNLIKKIESGDRDIYEEYISYRCYKGKPIPSIERRRKIEFQLLYIP